jgi:cardiolipin synthase
MITGLFTIGALEFLIRLVLIVIVLIRPNARPATTVAWVLLLVAIPIVGLIAYLMFGEVRLGRRRARRHREIKSKIDSCKTLITSTTHRQHAEVPVRFESIAILAESVGDDLVRGGNYIKLIGDTDLFIQSLIEDIDAATHHCHLLFFIFGTDHSSQRVIDALGRAAQRGVTCRLLVDAVGSKLFLRSELRRTATDMGVNIVEALPVSALRMLFARVDIRNHRKIVVIDGRISYTGSHNISDAEFAVKARYAPWVDAIVRVEGPVTRDLQILFIQDWFMDTDESLDALLEIEPPYFEDGVLAQVLGSGPSTYNEAIRQLLQTALHAAREEIILTTPYFVPDEATVTSLCTSAHRNVDTTLVVPARNDSPLVAAASRCHYSTLLASGVRICEYTRGLLHSKTLSIDRDLAIIGTANLDRRSFELNFEVTLVVYDYDFSSELRFMQRSYMYDSREVDPVAWPRRFWGRRLVENAAGTLSPLL